jgi:hypothetical protein
MQQKQEWDCRGWKGDRRIFVFLEKKLIYSYSF